MKNFSEWLLAEGRKYLHTVGFMDSSKSVIQVMLDGTLHSSTGLIFLRPASFRKTLSGPQHATDTVWVELGREPRLLVVNSQAHLMSMLAIESPVKMSAHTDIPEIATQVAARLRERGYDGFSRRDFPEIAVLSDVPNKVVGRLEGDFYVRDAQGKPVRVPGQ